MGREMGEGPLVGLRDGFLIAHQIVGMLPAAC
jgi:hypothetical protein